MGDEELVREVWRRWNAGERELDDETFDPDIEIHSALTGNVYRGRDGAQRWISEIEEQFESWELTIDEVTEIEPRRLLVRGAIKARGRNSGVALDQPASWLVEVTDGRVASVRNFIGREPAG